jgi:hypothetical protein
MRAAPPVSHAPAAVMKSVNAPPTESAAVPRPQPMTASPSTSAKQAESASVLPAAPPPAQVTTQAAPPARESAAPAAPARADAANPAVRDEFTAPVSGSAGKDEAGRARSTDPNASLYPEHWLANIRRMLKENRRDEALRSLAEFRRMYPAYHLPEDLRGLGNP